MDVPMAETERDLLPTLMRKGRAASVELDLDIMVVNKIIQYRWFLKNVTHWRSR